MPNKKPKRTIKKLSGYRILKAYGTGEKDQADQIRDLIFAAVEPPMTKDEIETLPLNDLMDLSNEIVSTLGLHEDDIKKIQNSMT